jgi:hypothetical protein
MDLEVRALMVIDFGQHLDNAVLERLGTDEADFGVVAGLPQEMLAAAKSDLQPDLTDRRLE